MVDPKYNNNHFAYAFVDFLQHLLVEVSKCVPTVPIGRVRSCPGMWAGNRLARNYLLLVDPIHNMVLSIKMGAQIPSRDWEGRVG